MTDVIIRVNDRQCYRNLVANHGITEIELISSAGRYSRTNNHIRRFIFYRRHDRGASQNISPDAHIVNTASSNKDRENFINSSFCVARPRYAYASTSIQE